MDLNLALGLISLALTVITLVIGFVNWKLNNKLKIVEDKLSGEWEDLWLLHEPRPYVPKRSLLDSILRRDPEDIASPNQKRICIFNQKGGVGKTTLALNLAAYFEQRGKKILLIDLDYQGSLSNAVLQAINSIKVDSDVDALFTDAPPTAAQLGALMTGLGPKLPNTRIIISSMSFGKLENKLMAKFAINGGENDIRHAIVRSLPRMREFDVIIFDCPPRLTTGTVNAVCASTHALLPTVLDRMSTRAVAPTIESLKKLTGALNPDVQVLGAVGNLTREKERSKDEDIQFGEVQKVLHRLCGPNAKMFDRTIPRRVVVSRADDIPYIEADSQGVEFHNLFEELGDEIAASLWPSDRPKLDPLPPAPPDRPRPAPRPPKPRPSLADIGLEAS